MAHQYTVAELKLANLKGDDYYRARYIVDACSSAGELCVLLASMQKVVSLVNSEKGEESTSSELGLVRIVDLEGFPLGESVGISELFILQEWLYESRDPDSQHGGQYLGNRYADIDRSYDDTVRW